MWTWILQALRRYGDFDGRSNPGGFALFWLFQRLVVAAANLAGGALGMKLTNPYDLTLFAVLSVIPLPFTKAGLVVFLVLIIPGLAVAVRRLHDRGLNGAWLALPVILGGGVSLVAFLMAVVGAFFGREADNNTINLFLAMCAAVPAGATLITFFVLASLRSSETPNRYGTVPKGQMR